MPKPIAVFFAGCNGAGKSTLRDEILKSNQPFIDADLIAKQVNFSHLPNKDIAAGREAVRRFRYYLQEKQSFSIETTLSGVSALNNMRKVKNAGFEVHLYYCGLASVELNIARVAMRVAKGGHNIPETTIRRRYDESLQNLKTALEIADEYYVFDNSSTKNTHQICISHTANNTYITDIPKWLEPHLPKTVRAKQLFNDKLATLSDTDRQNVLIYEKDLKTILANGDLTQDQQDMVMANFYTNAADKIQNGQSLLPKAVGLENITLTSDNRQQGDEPEMDR